MENQAHVAWVILVPKLACPPKFAVFTVSPHALPACPAVPHCWQVTVLHGETYKGLALPRKAEAQQTKKSYNDSNFETANNQHYSQIKHWNPLQIQIMTQATEHPPAQ